MKSTRSQRRDKQHATPSTTDAPQPNQQRRPSPASSNKPMLVKSKSSSHAGEVDSVEEALAMVGEARRREASVDPGRKPGDELRRRHHHEPKRNSSKARSGAATNARAPDSLNSEDIEASESEAVQSMERAREEAIRRPNERGANLGETVDSSMARLRLHSSDDESATTSIPSGGNAPTYKHEIGASWARRIAAADPVDGTASCEPDSELSSVRSHGRPTDTDDEEAKLIAWLGEKTKQQRAEMDANTAAVRILQHELSTGEEDLERIMRDQPASSSPSIPRRKLSNASEANAVPHDSGRPLSPPGDERRREKKKSDSTRRKSSVGELDKKRSLKDTKVESGGKKEKDDKKETLEQLTAKKRSLGKGDFTRLKEEKEREELKRELQKKKSSSLGKGEFREVLKSLCQRCQLVPPDARVSATDSTVTLMLCKACVEATTNNEQEFAELVRKQERRAAGSRKKV